MSEKKRLILQGIAEGKITSATQKWWESLSEEDLKNHLPTAPVIVKQINHRSPSMKNLIDYSAVLRERERKQRAETVKSGIAQTAAFIAGIAIGIMIGIGIHLIP